MRYFNYCDKAINQRKKRAKFVTKVQDCLLHDQTVSLYKLTKTCQGAGSSFPFLLWPCAGQWPCSGLDLMTPELWGSAGGSGRLLRPFGLFTFLAPFSSASCPSLCRHKQLVQTSGGQIGANLDIEITASYLAATAVLPSHGKGYRDRLSNRVHTCP